MDEIAAVLRAVAPRAKPEFVAGSVNLGSIMARWGFDTVEAQAELIAQTAHESGGFTAFAENLNYSAQRLCQVWPNRFRSLDAARPFAKNPKALANNVYAGRMGNLPGTDDGWDFRGSGALQHTGRNEFARVQKRTGLQVVAEPDSLRDSKQAEVMWNAACSYFVDRNALAPAKAGDTDTVTVRVNGGRNGLADRKLLKHRAMAVMSGTPIPVGKTTVEQSNDAKRKARQAGTIAAPAGGVSGGAAKQGGGADSSTAISIGLVVIVAVLVIGFIFWRKHKTKQAEVEAMQLQGIQARLALAQG